LEWIVFAAATLAGLALGCAAGRSGAEREKSGRRGALSPRKEATALERQYLNFLSYNGTDRGQMKIEDRD
jgi:hypothetical protein